MLELPDLLTLEVDVHGDSSAPMELVNQSADGSQMSPKLSQVVPPEVICHHIPIAGRNYLSIKVSNVTTTPAILKEAQVLVNKNELHQSNQKLLDSGTEGRTAEGLSEVVDKVSVKIPIGQLQLMPFSLLRHEEFVFLCNVELQSAQIGIAKFQKIKIPLLFALTFQTEIDGSQASMRVQYTLPKLRLQSPSLVMHTECTSPVKLNNCFTVTYTIQNNLQDFMGITLAWIPSMPSHDASADETKHAVINESLVCQQPVTEVGACRKGSTLSVKVDFQALATGVHEVGKLMKLKLQYSIPSPDPLGAADTTPVSPSHRVASVGTLPRSPSSPAFHPRSPQSMPRYTPGSPLSSPVHPPATHRAFKYDVPVLEQHSMDLPPFVRYLSQSQIRILREMRPRQRTTARSFSYGGEVPAEDRGSRKRPPVVRQLSGSSDSSFRRKRPSYADHIVKHPCQVYVMK